MTTRTTSQTATFSRPFKLGGMERHYPAGSYRVETDEALIEDLSFAAYRRTATFIVLPSEAGGTIASETIRIDPAELQRALGREPETAASETPAAIRDEPMLVADSDNRRD